MVLQRPERLLAILFTILLVSAPAVLLSQTVEQRAALGTLWYERYENERKVGWISVRFSAAEHDGRPAMELRARMMLHVRRGERTIEYESEDVSLFDGDFRLVRFETDGRLDGEPLSIRGERTDAGFAVTVRMNDEERSRTFARDDYDATSGDELFRGLTAIGQERAYRMLDFETLAIVDAVFRLEGREECRVAGRTRRCGRFYSRKGVDVSNLWITPDTGILVRQRGVGRDGLYEIRLSDEATARRMPAEDDAER